MKSFGYVFGFTCIFLAMFLWAAGKADADPYAPYCFDERLCGDLSDSYYCPGMSGRVGPFDSCSGLVTGPYAPGGLRPNEGLGR